MEVLARITHSRKKEIKKIKILLRKARRRWLLWNTRKGEESKSSGLV